jgi:hypothetical protein
MLMRSSRLAIAVFGAGSASSAALTRQAVPAALTRQASPAALTRQASPASFAVRARPARLLAAVAAFTLAAAGVTGCSLAIHDAADQCSVDADCTDFDSSAVCRQGVCVASGLGPPGCFAGTPTTDAQLRKRCTTAQCISFDNCARLGICGAPASLPPLKAPPQP